MKKKPVEEFPESYFDGSTAARAIKPQHVPSLLEGMGKQYVRYFCASCGVWHEPIGKPE